MTPHDNEVGDISFILLFPHFSTHEFCVTLHLNMVVDIDECQQTPGICEGLCHNTNGSFTCTKCPGHTVYDAKTMQCISTPKRNLILGESRNWSILQQKRCFLFAK